MWIQIRSGRVLVNATAELVQKKYKSPKVFLKSKQIRAHILVILLFCFVVGRWNQSSKTLTCTVSDA